MSKNKIFRCLFFFKCRGCCRENRLTLQEKLVVGERLMVTSNWETLVPWTRRLAAEILPASHLWKAFLGSAWPQSPSPSPPSPHASGADTRWVLSLGSLQPNFPWCPSCTLIPKLLFDLNVAHSLSMTVPESISKEENRKEEGSLFLRYVFWILYFSFLYKSEMDSTMPHFSFLVKQD